MKTPRTVIATVLLMACAMGVSGALASPPLTGVQATAGFLYNCAMFVEWPGRSGGSRDIVIGVSAADQVLDVIRAMEGRTVNGHTLHVKSLGVHESIEGYHILFVGGSAREAQAVLARVGDADVLTVSELDDFTERGGAVRLYTDQDRLRFEINMTRVERAGLKVSAKMLGLARIVR